MNKSLKLEIMFEAGSDFQWELARSMFDGIGKATAMHLNDSHKGNKIIWSIEEAENGLIDKLTSEMEEGAKLAND